MARDQSATPDSYLNLNQQRGKIQIKGATTFRNSPAQPLGALLSVIPDQVYAGLESVCAAIMQDVYDDLVLQVMCDLVLQELR